MKLKSYAKINLTLDVLGVRSDGYHEIETIYQQISLHDDVELEATKDNKIILECNVREIENTENLAYKTALLLRNKYKIRSGVKIKITKNIPVGSGLSGGSSNAAAVLVGLNKLWGLGAKEEELIEISARLGSDVPFHVLGGTCLGTGRGEKIKKLKNFKKYFVVLIYPNFSVSTEEAYRRLDVYEGRAIYSTRQFLENFDLGYLHNDFEASVFLKYPVLAEVKKQLGPYSLLTGTGSCVYGLFEDFDIATKILSSVSKSYSSFLVSC